MSKRDWFRNETWDAGIEAAFEARLNRARDKVQPLKLQALHLARSRPEVALRLLDRYFRSGDTLHLAAAFAIQAEARIAIGDVASAANSYELALAREAEWPQLKTIKTNSFLDYPLLVAEHRLTDRYDNALRVLEVRRSDCAFPVQHFIWHAARALIRCAQGATADAAAEARSAIAAADETSSGFRYHQSLGLVGAEHDQLKEQLRRLFA